MGELAYLMPLCERRIVSGVFEERSCLGIADWSDHFGWNAGNKRARRDVRAFETTAPAAMRLPSPIVAPFMTTAPIPTSTPSPIVAPWHMAPWPRVVLLPMVSGNPGSAWRTQLSWTFVWLPMWIGAESAR
jgi:hypothetical protein